MTKDCQDHDCLILYDAQQCYENLLWRHHGRNQWRICSLPPQHGGGNAGFLWQPMAAAFFITECWHGMEIVKKAKRHAAPIQKQRRQLRMRSPNILLFNLSINILLFNPNLFLFFCWVISPIVHFVKRNWAIPGPMQTL